MIIRRKIIKSLKTLTIALAINQMGGALIPSSLMTYYRPKAEIVAEEIGRSRHLSPESSAKDYADLANSLIQEQFSGKNVQGELDCKDYAFATQRAYLTLVKKDGRVDLEGKIRIVLGLPSDAGASGHVWLEVKEDGKFQPYESHSFSPNKSKINGDLDEEGWVIARSFNGTHFFHPTLGSFFYPGGLARMWYLANSFNEQ